MCKVTINGIDLQARPGMTILGAAKIAGVRIPTLCFLKDVSAIASCRMCVVEVEGCSNLVAACNTPVTEGMVVTTESDRIASARKMALKLIMAGHRTTCLTLSLIHI